MRNQKCPIIAVVTALASGFAEKELLRGILNANRKAHYATVVLSNIYNLAQEDDELLCEQRIYELVRSKDISGILLLSESFVNENSRAAAAELLSQTSVPIIGVGSDLPEYASLHLDFLNTSDADDLGRLTTHLIEEHGFTDIAMLTGMEEISISHERVRGYKEALRRHGIMPRDDLIYFGDFWNTSGEALADRYIRRELPLPQAIVCANDRMAYGLLSRFSEAGIHVPEHVTVVSYEYSDARLYFTPALTCFRRNREALGAAAAQRLHSVLEGTEPPAFMPPAGTMVYGASCPCPTDEAQVLSELKNAALRQSFNDLNLFSSMEHKLTLCRDMEEFVGIIGNFQWMIGGKKNAFLRLFTNWYDTDPAGTETMLCRSIMPWSEHQVFETDALDLHALFEREPEAMVCYYSPVFSGKKLFGDMALMYAVPESYDDVYRHWLKSVSIGLEFLRLKNDIRYLLSCQSVSEYRDTLTGMYNEKGLKRAFQAVTAHDGRTLYGILLRICMQPHRISDEDLVRKTGAVQSVAKALSKFCGNHDIAGRIGEETFFCIAQSHADAQTLSDLLCAVLIQDRRYLNYAGMDSFACAAVPCGDSSFEEMVALCTQQISVTTAQRAERRRNRYYEELLDVRNRIFQTPEITFEQDSEIISTERQELFRANYKKCFGLTFHQDGIAARIARAKYYLVTTSLSTADISEKCGYLDPKYFHRQFSACTGMPAMQYRNLIKG